MKFNGKKLLLIGLCCLPFMTTFTPVSASGAVRTKDWSTPGGTGKTNCSVDVDLSDYSWDIRAYIWSTSLLSGYSHGDVWKTSSFSNGNKNCTVYTSVPIYNPLGTHVYTGANSFNFWVSGSTVYSS